MYWPCVPSPHFCESLYINGPQKQFTGQLDCMLSKPTCSIYTGASVADLGGGGGGGGGGGWRSEPPSALKY